MHSQHGSADLPAYNPKAKAALLQAVQDQLQSAESKEVRGEYARLLREGISDVRAREAIGLVLAVHLARMLKRNADFDYQAYVKELRKLPEFDQDQPI